MKWSYPTQGRIDSSPEIGSDGTIYVGSGDTNLYAIYSDGTLKFKYKTEGSVLSSPVISEEGIIYFRSNDGYLYAIDSGTNAGLANTPWPMFGHNQLHTHRSQIESYAVTGNVLMGDKGLPNVNVTLERIGFSQVQQTDHEGFYSLNNVLNGTYTITFHKDGVPLNPSSIEITVNDLDIIVQTIAATNYITILTPNGNEILEANTQYIISWKLHNVEEISIDYSEDGGLSWTQVASNISTPVRSYPWTIPNISSNQCIVKLTDVSNSSVFDMSDSTFTIERDQEYGIQISDTGVSKSSLSLSPNGNWITYIEDGDVWVMSLNGGEPINFSEDIEHGCYKPSFTLDSDNILFSFGYIKVEFGIGDVYYSTIHEKNIKTLELIKSTTSGYITGQWKGWSKNGRFVYSVSSRQSAWGNYQLSIIDNIGQSNYSEEYSEMGDPSGRPGISSIIFSPDDTHFVISNNNLIRRINFETGLCDTLEIDGPCSDYSPDGKWIMYNTDKLHVYNTETGINYPVFQDEEYLANSGCFSPDGSKICYLHPINGFTEVFIADFPYYSPVFVNENETPTEFSLSQNYPNPFNEVTIIKYSLPQKSHVTFIIYNLTGQAISVLKNENQKAGNYSITWNAAEMPSGLYFFTLSADNFTETRKMILVK